MATAAKASATRITNLSNGLTVATEENSSAGAATVGVWIDAGSRVESAKTNGAANLLEHIAIQVIFFLRRELIILVEKYTRKRIQLYIYINLERWNKKKLLRGWVI